MLRQHCATTTDTFLLMLLRHAGSCVELGLVTAHHAPSGVVTNRVSASSSAKPDVAPLVMLGLRLRYGLPARLMHGSALRLRPRVPLLRPLPRVRLRPLIHVRMRLRPLLRVRLSDERLRRGS